MAKRVDLQIIQAGYCLAHERVMMRGGSWRQVKAPATVAVIRHPDRGIWLFDTGYTERFYDLTQRFPGRLYRMATPVKITAEQTARAQLEATGVGSDDVAGIILSHFHADHSGGVADFRRARYVYLAHAYAAVKDLRGFRAVRRGILPDLLPDDFERRSDPLDAAGEKEGVIDHGPFTRGIDLFGDQTVVGVSLPGHAPGHMGLFVQTHRGPHFLVGDACWRQETIRALRMPHPMTALLHTNMGQYRETIHRLHALQRAVPTLPIIPCHCSGSLHTQAHRAAPQTPRDSVGAPPPSRAAAYAQGRSSTGPG